MIEIKRIYRDTCIYEILKLATYTGEFSKRTVHLLDHRATKMGYRYALDVLMRDSSYIDEDGNNYRDIKVLTGVKGEKSIAKKYDAYASYYLTPDAINSGIINTFVRNFKEADELKVKTGNKNVRERNVVQAENMYLMDRVKNILIQLGKKSGKYWTRSSLTERYRSRYNEYVNIEHGRYYGAVERSDRIYSFYHIKKADLKWNNLSESRCSNLIKNIFGVERKEKIKYCGMIMSGGFNAAKRLVLKEDERGLSLNAVYLNWYYVPVFYENQIWYETKFGYINVTELSLIFLLNKELEKELIDLCFEEGDDVESLFGIDCHGYSKKRGYIFVGFIMDLAKLRRFKMAGELEKGNQYSIVCFDWQENFYKSVLNETEIKIISFPTIRILKMLNML